MEKGGTLGIAKPFTIDQVSWHTSTRGNPESREHIIRRFHAIAHFLQDRGLTVRPLAGDLKDVQDNFAISSADLTDEGLALMRAAYDKWLQKVDQGMDIGDLSLLDKALQKIRAK